MIEFNLIEKTIFTFVLLTTAGYAFLIIREYSAIIRRGKSRLGRFSLTNIIKVLFQKVILLLSTWKTRFWSNLFHLFIVWGFIFFLIINSADMLSVFIGKFDSQSAFSNIFLYASDVVYAVILVSIVFFVIRRLLNANQFKSRENVMTMPIMNQIIRRDSLVVAGLIIIHVGSRAAAESIRLQMMPRSIWLPFSGLLSTVWAPSANLGLIWKLLFWTSILSLLIFIPYFPRSKHLHLFFAPLNFLFRSQQPWFSNLPDLNLDDPQIEVFGALRLEEMDRSAIFDSFACIMCFRCQEVCPPYQSGSPLSPAAYEINKRLFLNARGKQFAFPDFKSPKLTTYAISEQALWDCTACGACVEICPVGIDPLADILAIRRGLVLMEDKFPKPLQLLFKNVEHTANPWGISSQHRLDWAEGLQVTTINENPHPDILWWVGCAGAFEENAKKASRSFAKILNAAQVNYAVLGELENCSGDAVRRAGREDLYQQMALSNIEKLNQVNPKRIVTSCPHCLHNLKNDYRSLGGDFSVIHSSQYLATLVENGTLKLIESSDQTKISFHDSCYLSRFNQVADPVRFLFRQENQELANLKNEASNTFCCGAGGAQYWKESQPLSEPINIKRWKQLTEEPIKQVVTSCPFCHTMLSDAAKSQGSEIPVLDLSEHLLSKIQSENK